MTGFYPGCEDLGLKRMAFIRRIEGKGLLLKVTLPRKRIRYQKPFKCTSDVEGGGGQLKTNSFEKEPLPFCTNNPISPQENNPVAKAVLVFH